MKLLFISQRTQEKDWRYRAVENIEVRNWISRNNKRSDQNQAHRIYWKLDSGDEKKLFTVKHQKVKNKDGKKSTECQWLLDNFNQPNKV